MESSTDANDGGVVSWRFSDGARVPVSVSTFSPPDGVGRAPLVTDGPSGTEGRVVRTPGVPCGNVDGIDARVSGTVSDARDPLGNVRVSTVSGTAVEVAASGTETPTGKDGTATLGKPVTPEGKDTSVVGTAEPPAGNVELISSGEGDAPGRETPTEADGTMAVGSPGTPRGKDTSLVGKTDMADGSVPVTSADDGELGAICGTDTVADIEGTATVG